jgi:hypothetical protein
MDAYVPSYLYWEALDMFRKLALVGLVLIVGRGTIAQLAAAIMLSFGFFALQMKTWPYKLEADNLLRAATEMHVFIVITTALILKNDLSWEGVSVDAYDYVLFLSFIVLVPGATVLAVGSKVRYVSRLLATERDTDDALQRRQLAFDLQTLGLAEDEDREILKRSIEGWSVNKTYAAFLSHFKNEAAAEARVLKLELTRSLRTLDEQIFLDSDNLTDLRNLLDDVEQSDVILLLYTEGVLSRPWCLLELDTAVKAKVPIIVVKVNNAFAGDTDGIASLLDDLPAYLETHNPRCAETLRAFDFDVDAVEIAKTIKPALLEYEPLMFDPHQSSAIMHAEIAQMAQAMVDVACPENASLIPELHKRSTLEPWPARLNYAVYMVLEEQNDVVIEIAEEIKSWLLRNTALEAKQICIQTSDRSTDEVEAADLTAVAEEVDCVLLIQTSQVLYEPRCLARLYAAAKHRVPIVPVVLMSSKKEDQDMMYNFETAKPMLEDLSDYLEPPGAAAALEVAAGTSAAAIGLSLSLLLPNIISKPYGLGATVNETDAQMTEIERTMRGVSAVAQPGITATKTSTDVQTPRQVRPQPKKRKQELTAHQVMQLKLAFVRVDVNGDGDISKSEIMSALAKNSDLCDLVGIDLHPNATSEERMFEAGMLFKDMDTDGNSSVDVDEFVAFFGIAPAAPEPSGDPEAPAVVPEEPDWKAQRKAELAAELERVRNGQPQDETLVPTSSSEEGGGARP